jgi:hypothetical protein
MFSGGVLAMPKRRGLTRCLGLICLVLLPSWSRAEEKEKPKPPLAERISRTQHVLTLDGQQIARTAARQRLVRGLARRYQAY